MKTNVSIELTDDQRLDLAQKYNNTTNKKLLTRTELKDIVLNYIEELINVDTTVRKTTERVINDNVWSTIYYYNGRRLPKDIWDNIPEGPRKFYGFDQ